MIQNQTVAMAFLFALAFVLGGKAADALPIFAHEYGVPCQKCHTAIPSLNNFGRAYLANGYHIPGSAQPPPVFPIAVKLNVAYSSASNTGGLPKTILDELEVLTAGTVGTRGNYFAEQYAIDGGQHGNLREVWFNLRLTSDAQAVPIDIRAGQFTLPLPVDPESFRESVQHYAVFDQTVGLNPFNFFDPKLGVSARVGSVERGLNAEFSALRGHDVQSGLPTTGIDLMQTVHELFGNFDLSAYRYTGARTVSSGLLAGNAADDDRFSRTGIGLRFAGGRWTSESVFTHNTDSNFDGVGTALRSGGGFTQLRYAFTNKLFGLVRYDGTNDNRGSFRATTALLGYRLSHNSRVTVESVFSHAPTVNQTINSQFTIAY